LNDVKELNDVGNKSDFRLSAIDLFTRVRRAVILANGKRKKGFSPRMRGALSRGFQGPFHLKLLSLIWEQLTASSLE